MNRDGERMDTGNREIIGDRRRMREAAGRRYPIAFDIQSTPELVPEAILHEWPTSGTLYAVAYFWDISSGGPVLGHPLHNIAHFRASLLANPCGSLSRRVDRKP